MMRVVPIQPAKLMLIVLCAISVAQAQPKPDAPASTITRAYDVRELIISVDDSGGPSITDEWGFPSPTSRPQMQAVTKQQLVSDLIRKIESTVALESWKDNGGTVGIVNSVNGNLLITQTPENHELIGVFLDAWRNEKLTQITIESRFLGGVELQPSKGEGKWIDEKNSRRWSEFLNDDQVSDLLKIIQKNTNTTTISAPRLTLFNHQRSFIVVSNQTAYVAALTPQPAADGTKTYDPTIKNIPSGLAQDCRATTSADHQSVKLDLKSRVNRLLDLESRPIEGGNAKDGPFIQVPHVSSAILDASVDVPDGKTAVFQLTPQLKPEKPDAPRELPLLVLVKPTVIQQRQAP